MCPLVDSYDDASAREAGSAAKVAAVRKTGPRQNVQFPTHCGGTFGPIWQEWLLFSGRSRSENIGCLWRRPGQHLSLPVHLSFNPATQLHSAPSELP